MLSRFNCFKRVGRSFSTQFCRDVLKENGIDNKKAKLYYNLSYPEIREHEIKNKEGVVLKNGVFAVDTGEFTGRSPKDKYFVNREPSCHNIDWGKVNQPMSNETFEDLEKKVKEYYSGLDQIYIFDGYTAMGDVETRKKIRFITHYAFQHHFVKNMFYSHTQEELSLIHI